MTIDRLKLEHGWITVDYSGLLESFSITTKDEPKASLFAAAANVAILARIALGVTIERAGFVAIIFSRGDEPGSRLVLSIPTLTGDPIKLACPKISEAPVKNHETGFEIEGHPQNVYNAAVLVLETEIVEFVKGKRLQMALPFDMIPEDRKLRADVDKLLGDDASIETRDSESRVLDFAGRAAAVGHDLT